MASLSVPRPAKLSLDFLKKAPRTAGRLIRPVRPALSNLASVPLHVAGLGCIDFSAFHLAHGWGWLVTGASLIWLEHVIADEG
jgi:hypothetical protein